VVPGLPRANVTEAPFASVDTLSLTDPHSGEVPCSVIVPLNAAPVLFVTVTKPLSGLWLCALPMQTVLLVLQNVAAPVTPPEHVPAQI